MKDLPADLGDLLTTDEVAATCRTTASTVRYWRHVGTGPRSFRLGKRVVYPRHDLVLWLREQAARDNDRRN